MTNEMISEAQNHNHSHLLTAIEERIINQKVNFEIAKTAYKMAYLGSLGNIISSTFVLWIVDAIISPLVLFGWYIILVLTNVINVGWAFYNRDALQNPVKLKTWRNVLYFIFGAICLTWGSMPILFYSSDIHYQLYVLAFLLAVLIAFSFPSLIDFNLGVISISCLLLPVIIYYFYLGISKPESENLGIGIAIGFLILGSFLIIVCRMGAKLIKQFFHLSFTNVALNHKLENMNKFLEQRVKERTKELENSLKLVTYQATHDLLTGLPNQRLLQKYIKAAIKSAAQNRHMFAVIFFTINELDRIYNALGHQVSDMVIKTIAQRFRETYGEPKEINISAVSYTVTLSRKDIFVILVQPISSLEMVEKLAEALFLALKQPVYTEKQVLKLTGSMGIAVYPRNGRDMTSLLMNADAAMLSAKMSGGNSLKMYKSEINAAITQQLELESKLHVALEKSEFILQYQPIINLKNGMITGAEALVRWENPTLGRIGPDNFIPLAEANGIIIPLSEWILRTACRQAKHWHDQGFGALKLAVNLSAKQLHYRHIIESINNIIQDIQFKPQNLEFELTETTAFQKDILPIILKITEMGVGLSIDDFGTGYSSLSNLKLFPIDKLKIDKSFIQDVVTNDDSNAIVTNTITLAKNINITVVAEGVETKDQLEFLLKNGCDMAQGFYFSPAVDPDTFTEILKSKRQFL